MNFSGYHRILRRLLLLVIALIVYGSLYPWHFVARTEPAGAFTALFSLSRPVFDRFLLRDAIVNVTMYIPLGMTACMALRRAPVWLLVTLPLLLGAGLSTTMELAQWFEPGRNTNLVDLFNNILGTAAGMILGAAIEETADTIDGSLSRMTTADRGTLVLLVVWIVWLLFPVFPVTGHGQVVGKMRIFLSSPLFDPVSILSAAAAWYAAGRMLAVAQLRRHRLWLGLSLIAVPAQFFIVDRQPTPAFALGALAGVLLFLFAGATGNLRLEALMFASVILIRGLSPFHWTARLNTFDWIPFQAFLETEWQIGLHIFAEKLWFYGAAVWLLRAAGVHLIRAALVVAVLLFAIEIAQTHIPGRTAEVTDPILALFTGFGLAVLSPRQPQSVR